MMEERAAAPRSRAPAAARSGDEPPHYFRMMKELALLGYFTSEIGCMQAQRYVESPGRFDPCVPYRPRSTYEFRRRPRTSSSKDDCLQHMILKRQFGRIM